MDMFKGKTAWIIALGMGIAATGMAAGVSGASALNFTRRAVEFGPRPPGTPANTALQNYIIAELRKDGCEVIEDAFVANTPKGKIAMKNIVAKFPGKSGKAIALTGHFDTKLLPGKFVGADDGGSSTGLLLELARAFAQQPRVDDLYLAFFDGEEAFGEWSASDSLYGSKHLAERWGKDGTLKRIKGLINLDMIGDKNLAIPQETNGDASLRRLVWSMAATLGYKAYFTDQQIGEDDDHMPFVRAGVPAIDVIDVDYTPWHTDADTMDKISAQSLEIVGTVIYESVLRLEHQ
jgi:Zn-dependent M28 family amino/carboxypeptidase